MTAKEADLHALDEVLKFCLAQEAASNNKLAKAYLRIWNRLRKVYLRTDNNLNKVGGNA